MEEKDVPETKGDEIGRLDSDIRELIHAIPPKLQGVCRTVMRKIFVTAQDPDAAPEHKEKLHRTIQGL